MKQREIDHIEPAEDPVDDGPEDRMVVAVGDGDGERRTKADAVFRARHPDRIEPAVHSRLPPRFDLNTSSCFSILCETSKI